MKIRTCDEAYEIVTDDTPQGVYLIWLPCGEWLGLGMICDVLPSMEKALGKMTQIVNAYAELHAQGYVLHCDEEKWVFVHSTLRRLPFHTLGDYEARADTLSFTQL